MFKHWLIYLGASHWDQVIIKHVRKSGFHICVVDKDNNNPIKNYCDLFINLSVVDFNEIYLKIVESVDLRQIKEIYASGELSISTAMYLRRLLEIPSYISNFDQLFFNKNYCKRIWKENNILTPEFFAIDKNNILESKTNYPDFFIKPIDGFGGDGIIECSNTAEFRVLHRKLNQNSDRQYIVEEKIIGPEYNVAGFFIEEKYHPLYVNRVITNDKYQSQAIHFGKILPREKLEHLHDRLGRASKALSIKDGPISGNFISNHNGDYLLEVAPLFSRMSSYLIWKTCSTVPLLHYINNKSSFGEFSRLENIQYGTKTYKMLSNKKIISENVEKTNTYN